MIQNDVSHLTIDVNPLKARRGKRARERERRYEGVGGVREVFLSAGSQD